MPGAQFKETQTLIQWLLEGDVSIQYQVYRDLLSIEKPELQTRVALEGWGAEYLKLRDPKGHWGRGFYQPKWISSHYSLLDLKHIEISPRNSQIRESIAKILAEYKAADGGINPSRTIPESDACINGMVLTYACYFQMPSEPLHSIVDNILAAQMHDGGFNCDSARYDVVHSSLHTTISILEGIDEYSQRGYTYRLAELERVAGEACEFILLHKLFRSDRTGEIINKRFLMLSYPSRWFYDILRALEYFRSVGIAYDPRMQDALDVLKKKQRKDGRWPLQARHPGQTHFEMEKPGQPSRWNTLRAMRVLRHFKD
jgi:hypothetical protein